MTHKPVTIDQLVPNRALRDTIEAWRKKHPGVISDDKQLPYDILLCIIIFVMFSSE